MRFVNGQDQKMVLEMEPWVYRCSLVLLVELLLDGNVHSMSLTHSTFWAKLYGVRGFCMTIVVAQAIGVLLGDVIRVDNHHWFDCVGRFICICVCFGVPLPILNQTMVTFPEVRENMAEFKYEYLSY